MALRPARRSVPTRLHDPQTVGEPAPPEPVGLTASTGRSAPRGTPWRDGDSAGASPHPGLPPTPSLALCAAFPELSFPRYILDRLDILVPRRRVPAGQVLFAEGQVPRAFYLMGAGDMEARFIAEDGTTSTLERLRAPRLFGLAAFVTGRPARYETVAVHDCEVWVIGAAAYQMLMDECPGFARALLQEFARRFEGNLRLLDAARHQPAPERFRLALLQMIRDSGSPPDADGWQQLAATQADIARCAHLSRQTVNVLLGAAQAQGWVRRRYGQLSVLTPRL